MTLTFKQKLIKRFSPILLSLFRLYWFIFRPTSLGVKVIIEHNGKFLLVKNSYGYKRWTFPGGNIEKHEEPVQTALREVKEEVGLYIKNINLVGTILSTNEYKKDNIYIFYALSDIQKLSLDEFEILEAKWFSKDSFPDLSPVANKIWDKFTSKKSLTENYSLRVS